MIIKLPTSNSIESTFIRADSTSWTSWEQTSHAPLNGDNSVLNVSDVVRQSLLGETSSEQSTADAERHTGIDSASKKRLTPEWSDDCAKSKIPLWFVDLSRSVAGVQIETMFQRRRLKRLSHV